MIKLNNELKTKKLLLFENNEKLISLYTMKPFDLKNAKEGIFASIEKEIKYKFDNIIIPGQNHTGNITIVSESNINDNFYDTDGLITNLKNVALVTSLADCQGIFLYDKNKNVIANIHSGWKGTQKRIVKNCVEMMINNFHSNPLDIVVQITPSILGCCFEVDEDVKNLFLETFSDIKDFIRIGNIVDNNQKYYIDTIKINKEVLINLGVPSKNIKISNYCTKCNNKYFHSYRSDKEKSGRNVGLICLK